MTVSQKNLIEGTETDEKEKGPPSAHKLILIIFFCLSGYFALVCAPFLGAGYSLSESNTKRNLKVFVADFDGGIVGQNLDNLIAALQCRKYYSWNRSCSGF